MGFVVGSFFFSSSPHYYAYLLEMKQNARNYAFQAMRIEIVVNVSTWVCRWYNLVCCDIATIGGGFFFFFIEYIKSFHAATCTYVLLLMTNSHPENSNIIKVQMTAMLFNSFLSPFPSIHPSASFHKQLAKQHRLHVTKIVKGTRSASN